MVDSGEVRCYNEYANKATDGLRIFKYIIGRQKHTKGRDYNMDLKNKKIIFLGDSITEGVGASSADTNYVSVFGKISGAEVKNYGLSGTRIARQTGKTDNELFDRDFVLRADEMEPNADIVVVFGGTNDFGHGDAKIGDFSSRNVYTFYGAMHCLCEKLINKYPDAVIVFMTPLHRVTENNEMKENGIPNEVPLSGYVAIIKDVAGYYGLPVLDLFNMSGIQPSVEIIKQKYMPDGLHPSDKGARRIAERLYGFLSAL